MEYRLRPWVSWSFLQNNNHQAVKKMEWIENWKYEKIQTYVVVSVWVYVAVCICMYVL